MIQASARCGAHPEVAAVDVCKRCGRFLCGECVELVGENAYCTACSVRVDAPASVRAKWALRLAVGAWFVAAAIMFPHLPVVLASLPLSLIAIISAVLEWRSINRGESPQRGKRRVVAALVLATPLFLLMTAFVAYAARDR